MLLGADAITRQTSLKTMQFTLGGVWETLAGSFLFTLVLLRIYWDDATLGIVLRLSAARSHY
jgi:hypothetical protein